MKVYHHMSHKDKGAITIDEIGKTYLTLDFQDKPYGATVSIFLGYGPDTEMNTLADVEEAIATYRGKQAMKKAINGPRMANDLPPSLH